MSPDVATPPVPSTSSCPPVIKWRSRKPATRPVPHPNEIVNLTGPALPRDSCNHTDESDVRTRTIAPIAYRDIRSGEAAAAEQLF